MTKKMVTDVEKWAIDDSVEIPSSIFEVLPSDPSL
jgi:hypothetical protein